MTNKYKIVFKIVIQITLFVVFWFLFGRHSFTRFSDQQVLVTTQEKYQKYFSVPAVTICPLDAALQSGFKNVSTIASGLTGNLVWDGCKGLNQDAIVKCIEEHTYDQASTIVKVTQGFVSGDKMPDFKWIPDFTLAIAGICYTLETNYTLGSDVADPDATAFKIELDHKSSSVSFITHFHDPNFFVVNFNPVLPFNMRLHEFGPEKPIFKLLRFVVIKHVNRDVPSKRCNPNPTYSFTSCIKESFSAQVGCRLFWDSWTDRARPVCQDLTQYRYFGSFQLSKVIFHEFHFLTYIKPLFTLTKMVKPSLR